MKVEMNNICKAFGDIKVLKKVNLNILDGEIHALMGENGAGKSTLIKVLTGVYTKDDGEISIDGEKVEIKSIKDSEKYGIAYVHQELNVVKEMTICDNMFLGKELRKRGLLDKEKMSKICQEKLKVLGIDHLLPNTPMKDLSVGYQQMIEIAKALLINAKLVILDEPTAALTNKEIENLFRIVFELKNQGVSFLYVSHRMEEIFRICDNITILRDGTYIGTESLKEISEEKVVEMMTGKSIDNLYLKDEVVVGETVLEVENLSRKGEFENISFSVKAGEVLGFAGLMGSGRSEIMHAIFGSKNLENGKIFINGKEVLIKNPLDAKNHGIGFVTEDRKEEGLILDFDVRDNIAVPSLKKFINKFIVNEKKIDTVVDDYIKKLKIKVFNSNQKVKSLSGGNQQKIVFAKWLETSPKILILDEPTRGVDVGAKKEIYEVINELKRQGVAIILVSSELSEVVGVSDRVAVIHNKKIAKIFEDKNINQEEVLRVAFLGGN
ncbi:sugar ABC transporter ATP-binding protein [Cetobacterium sp. 2A]|uniref:sugar ABC transporter ATP-binding protein n=1 Tax=unclassified Cetobacterium TaxID=2630983 RepID=UPI00163C819B|nr:sugar ABC transporter ATP-binding protein [Cetobacterium sp. 2A]MBC2857275.1 sugar ABC transporter ATP-binding protein [Cetobacterium sp. 2A]